MSARIGEILVRAKILDQLQLRSALAHQQQWGGRLARVVAEKHFAKESVIVDALSKALGVARVELDKIEKDAAALAKLDPEFAKQNAIFPCALKDGGKTLWVAMADPSDIPTIDQLALRTGARVRPVVSGETEILAAIERHYYGRDPSRASPQAFGTIVPVEGEEDEGKLVDMAGRTIIKNIKDLTTSKPLPTAAAPAPAASSAVGSMLDDLLGSPAGPSLSPAEAERVRAIQDQQEKGARILRAVLDLCMEKRVFASQEYRAKLTKS